VLLANPTAVLFPGQGSQMPAMRELVASVRPDLLVKVTALVGEDPFRRADESTRFAQPAIFCASLAGWERVRDHVDPVAFAGHSLGELTALVAAGALHERDGLRLVVLRGLLMAISGEQAGGGTMLVVRGTTPPHAAAIAARNGVTLANDNAPGELVLSGARDALAAAAADAARDGLRTAQLDVAGAFHSPQIRTRSSPSARRWPRCSSPSRRSGSSRAPPRWRSSTRARSSPRRSFGRCAGARRWSRSRPTACRRSSTPDPAACSPASRRAVRPARARHRWTCCLEISVSSPEAERHDIATTGAGAVSPRGAGVRVPHRHEVAA